MILLRPTVNKSLILGQMNSFANKAYRHAWQKEIAIDGFMFGIQKTIEALQLKKIK